MSVNVRLGNTNKVKAQNLPQSPVDLPVVVGVERRPFEMEGSDLMGINLVRVIYF